MEIDILPSSEGAGSVLAGATAVDIEGAVLVFCGGTWMGSGCKRGGKNTAEFDGPEGIYVAGGGVNGAPPGVGLKGAE
jgi:hypothetical protein